MSKKWNKERKQEPYYKMAKKESYHSRASYKLLQLNKKFNIIKNGDVVVDLGAAPGGWSQVALEKVGEEGLVVGVDLQRIKPMEASNFVGIVGDFNSEDTIENIEKITRGKVDVILSDASPKLSGVKDVDQLCALELALGVVKIARLILKPRGRIVIKAFQGEEFENLLKELKKVFKSVKTTKPPSSRKKSVEMYIIAKK
ncbi:MAG: RlmE family RNA methyltransferase [Methanobacterium sp.]|nr:RlmE family RNA methyltransferase [Methanobacterium sp.]